MAWCARVHVVLCAGRAGVVTAVFIEPSGPRSARPGASIASRVVETTVSSCIESETTLKSR
jgi:hypothetical protein